MTYQVSKAKYSKYIVPILQKCIDDNQIKTFLGPFCGGANIIKNIKCENRIASDIDKNLIALWKELQKPDFVWPDFPQREDWDRCKNGEEEREWYIGLVSIFASNMVGGFPAGYERLGLRYNGRINTCKKDLPLIGNISFICSDYKEIFNNYTNSLIYCDPPYACKHQYNYKRFNSEEFWENVRQASRTNFIFVSEQTAPDGFICIWSLPIKHKAYNSIREATEKLFIYKEGLAAEYIKGDK